MDEGFTETQCDTVRTTDRKVGVFGFVFSSVSLFVNWPDWRS